MMAGVDVRLRTFLLSKVVTRVIQSPPLEVTHRQVDPPQAVFVPTRHGDVRCLITKPAAGAPLSYGASSPPPVHVNLHGGAFIIGAPQQDEHIARAVAGEVGAFVVNVDYSTAPRARFPRAVEECADVLTWVAGAGSTHNWDVGRISIGGGSSGGNLALGVLQLARRAGAAMPSTAVLVAPMVDATLAPDSYVTEHGKTFVTPALVRTVEHAYFAGADRSHPLASPMLADLDGLPPLLVIAAEYDSLRPQIEAFVEKAQRAGTPVDYRCFPGVDHDFPVRPQPDVRAAQLEMLSVMQEHLLKHLE